MEIALHVDLPDIEEMLGAEAGDLLRDVTVRLADRMRATHGDAMPSGRLYRRGRGFHRASAPGQPPAVDSGNLLGSIQPEINLSELTGEISLNAYGWFLEVGTDRVAERSWIMPSLDEVLKEFK